MYSYTCEYLYISLFIIFEFKVIITLNTSKIQMVSKLILFNYCFSFVFENFGSVFLCWDV